ncbi:MAG: NAD(P)-binding protein [Solirubrobacteraceae bacterium]
MSEKPFAITLDVGSSRANQTGSWRTERPIYVHRQAPCGHACPSGEDVQAWLYHAEEGDYESAWRKIIEQNPLPAVMGRICYHPCESSCNRAQLDETVGINSIERCLGDEAIRQGWLPELSAPPSGKRVLVIGSGPSGLSAAYHLALLGHHVTVRDAFSLPGGMMRYGIPTYRLPRHVLDAEIARILELGVELESNSSVTDALAAMREGSFDAVFLAVGAQLGKRTYIPAGSAAHMLDAVSLLHSMEGEERPQLGRRVVVYGGGDTAIDAARTAKRLGAEEAVIVYRRTREKMPAHDSELEEALAEGVLTKWLSTVKRADEGKLMVERMELDDTGFPQPTGELEELEADSLILALGQETDLSLLAGAQGITERDGVVEVGGDMMTGHPGIFAGGDMVPAERTATVAIGHGKLAARNIDAWLRGAAYTPPTELPLVTFEDLNTWYYADAPTTVRPELDAVRRASTFDEVVGGLDRTNALFEARRCMSCGSCLACDNCFGVCPDNAVLKLEPSGSYAYEIDLDFCKGCGLCAQECPCGAIEMVPEQI